jgi:hypothetical protein
MNIPNCPSPCLVHFSVQIADPVSSDQFYATADRIPALPGAYLLLVEVGEATFVVAEQAKCKSDAGTLYLRRLREWARRAQSQSF